MILILPCQPKWGNGIESIGLFAALGEERGVNEADLLREAMDDFLTKYGVNDIET